MKRQTFFGAKISTQTQSDLGVKKGSRYVGQLSVSGDNVFSFQEAAAKRRNPSPPRVYDGKYATAIQQPEGYKLYLKNPTLHPGEKEHNKTVAEGINVEVKEIVEQINSQTE